MMKFGTLTISLILTLVAVVTCDQPLGPPDPAGGEPPASGPTAGPTARAQTIPEGDPTAVVPTAMVATPTAGVVPDDWPTYRNDPADYTVQYPPTWTVDERADPDGSFSTTFSPPSGGTGIEVRVVAVEAAGVEGFDLPNTRCQPVTIGGLSGTRCLDTISFITSTTLFGPDRAYIISSSDKPAGRTVYEGLLQSFAPLP